LSKTVYADTAADLGLVCSFNHSRILPYYVKMIASPTVGIWLSISGAKLYLNGSDSAIWIFKVFMVLSKSLFVRQSVQKLCRSAQNSRLTWYFLKASSWLSICRKASLQKNRAEPMFTSGQRNKVLIPNPLFGRFLNK